jgi:mycothiol synthase
MTTLTRRPSTGRNSCYALAVSDCDVNSAKLFADIADLVKLNDAHGQLDDDTLVCDLQGFFNAPDVDKTRDLRVWQDSRGKLIGFGQLLVVSELEDGIEAYLYFDIQPAWRGNTLETEIIEWGEARMGELGRERNLPVKLLNYCRNDRFNRLILLEEHGFTLKRSFLTMACSLNQPLSSPSLPSGFQLQRLSDFLEGDRTYRSTISDHDLQAWVRLFNESFIDHWNHQDLTVEAAKHWLFNNPHYNSELNLIAVAPDGTFAAFCLGYINWEENLRSGHNEGWIKLLGTRRGFRRLGLGKAVLLAQMAQLKAAGIEQVKLGVDAQSVTSATQLYQSVGFQPIKTWLSYVKQI